MKEIMTYKVDILIQEKQWTKEIPNIQKLLNQYFYIIFDSFRKFKNKNLEVSVLLTNSENMKKINKKFKKKFKDTDVLSFPNHYKNFYLKKNDSNKIFLGDLAFSYKYIKKQKVDFLEYLKKVFVHGCLHLIGYNHNNIKSYDQMSKIEKKLLSLI